MNMFWTRIIFFVSLFFIIFEICSSQTPLRSHSRLRENQLASARKKALEKCGSSLPQLYQYPPIDCSHQISGLKANKTPGDGGYHLRVLTNKIGYYIPDQTYEVTLRGNRDFMKFEIYIEGDDTVDSLHNMRSLPLNARDQLGFISIPTTGLARLSETCPNTVRHVSASHKYEVSVSWRAPLSEPSCVTIKAIVVRAPNEWYKEEGGLRLRLCPDLTKSIDEQPEILSTCNTCDEASYQVVFRNLWTRHTHPSKDYPPCYESFYTSMVGASHSNDYRLWEVDKEASSGLKNYLNSTTQPFEHPNASFLLTEIRQDPSKIRSIINSRPLKACEKQGEDPDLFCRRLTFASFRTSQKHHQFSFVSRLNPSPDWFVGVSAFELCLKNGSWLTERRLNLYLHDGGILKGNSYYSGRRKRAERPQKPITKIVAPEQSNSEGIFDDEIASFYRPDGSKMKPFAWIHVKRLRLYKRECEESSMMSDRLQALQPESESDEIKRGCEVTPWQVSQCVGERFVHGQQNRTRNYIDSNSAYEMECRVPLTERRPCVPGCRGENICEVSEWTEWSECEDVCSYRTRTRRFIYSEGYTFCTHISLNMSIPCGDRSGCQEREDALMESMSTQDSQCATGEWSDWSECSVSCGRGSRTRNREYLRDDARETCNEELIETTSCYMGDCDRKRKLNTSYRESSLPRTRNLDIEGSERKVACARLPRPRPCQPGTVPKESTEKRWYYDHDTKSCAQFQPTGCEQWNNNFSRRKTCERTCMNPPIQ
ncbi:spondin-1-like [Brevipalpus obovatus]|uniref:spondin-1-like n=1 Tax=Brevipalpus obovatus TaxID=246614 RepID=UPI003D9E73CE